MLVWRRTCLQRFPAGEDGAALTSLDLGRLVNELKAISCRWMNCRRIRLAGAQSGPELCERWQAPALTINRAKNHRIALFQQQQELRRGEAAATGPGGAAGYDEEEG